VFDDGVLGARVPLAGSRCHALREPAPADVHSIGSQAENVAFDASTVSVPPPQRTLSAMPSSSNMTSSQRRRTR
jgi:hypothetical protein